MDTDKQLESAKFQLNLILSLFSRVDSRASVILGICLGMLAFLASNIPSIETLEWYMVIPGFLTLLPIGYSLFQLYQCAFPRLTGGSKSLVFFREIANRRESEYIEEFAGQDIDTHIKDLSGQVWRNSEILASKYDHLKNAFIGMSVAIPFWLFALASFTVVRAQIGSHLIS